MTLVATATIDSVDSSAVDGEVIVRAIAESDAIDTNTEGPITSIEVLIKCPTDPGLKVGNTLTISSHFVAIDPTAPTTPVNAVGPDATEPEPATDSDVPTEDAAGTPAPVAEPVGTSETAPPSDVAPAAVAPGDDASAAAAADTSGAAPLVDAGGSPLAEPETAGIPVGSAYPPAPQAESPIQATATTDVPATTEVPPVS